MHDAIPSRILNGWLRLEEDLFHLQVLSSLPPQIGICCSIFIFKLYHKTCEQFYRHFGLYEKSPNSSLPGLPRLIINQFRFHNFLCLCLASVHLPHPFHLVFGFQFLGHAVSLRQLRHDQLHAVSCRFVNLSAILSYLHPAISASLFCCSFLILLLWCAMLRAESSCRYNNIVIVTTLLRKERLYIWNILHGK